MVDITSVNLLSLATSIPYADQLSQMATNVTTEMKFLSYDDTFANSILGPDASATLVSELPWDAFHEAGVYNQATRSLYITSNWNGSFDNPINITVLNLDDDSITSERYPNVNEANGGAAYYPPDTIANSSAGQQIVFCDEGDLINPSQLTLVDPSTNTTKVLLNSFLGRNFSSVNDVEQHHETGDLWFTDARYGYWQYFRPEPVIRPQVYRFEPLTGVVRAVADDFIAPNGIEFSPDFKHLYVTDTGSHTFPNKDNLTDPATIYRFDITPDGKRLQNRQVFAYLDSGFPDGIHTDTDGNVYSSCGDGIHVWNKHGVLLGKMLTDGESNNFAFVPGGMYIFNAYKLWKVSLAAEGRTVRKDFGST
ncbi:putative smp-30 gluconolaconase lre-like region [Phaeomoniella chlamydospora]|uniref:Putative smp-30 gluconolaconase lre-like region n=1 Tax=Phaeomoniella chlamydospora TaxID=158046 RepID=A0A0G2DVE1_PHACM|nr:putative smp-30 gluconolaconase lre-like region [Phaeomoniella chlamydospora]